MEIMIVPERLTCMQAYIKTVTETETETNKDRGSDRAETETYIETMTETVKGRYSVINSDSDIHVQCSAKVMSHCYDVYYCNSC